VARLSIRRLGSPCRPSALHGIVLYGVWHSTPAALYGPALSEMERLRAPGLGRGNWPIGSALYFDEPLAQAGRASDFKSDWLFRFSIFHFASLHINID
jgi:hypothetical protein